MKLLVLLAAGLAILSGAPSAHVQSDRFARAQSAQVQSDHPSLFVGPQTRGGFLDIDAGIRDSIRDIKEQARAAGFKLAGSEKDATLVVVVLGRGIVTAGSIGVSSASVVGGAGSGFGFTVPNEKPTVSSLLRVSSYERLMQSEGGTWTAAAKAVVEDLEAWWDSNAAAVRQTALKP